MLIQFFFPFFGQWTILLWSFTRIGLILYLILVFSNTVPIAYTISLNMVELWSNMIGSFLNFFQRLHFHLWERKHFGVSAVWRFHTTCCLTGKENVTTLHITKLTWNNCYHLKIQLPYILASMEQLIACTEMTTMRYMNTVGPAIFTGTIWVSRPLPNSPK